MDLVTRVLVEALPSLGSEEEILAVPCHPWANTQFSVPIAGRDVDMIDAVFEEDVEHAVCLGLRGTAERRRAKECDCAHMSSASKRSFLNHGMFLSCACEGYKFSCRLPETRGQGQERRAITTGLVRRTWMSSA